MLQVAHGLEHLHALGYLHLNIKPSNVLLFSDGCVKLTDHGVLGNNALCRGPLQPDAVVCASSPRHRVLPLVSASDVRWAVHGVRETWWWCGVGPPSTHPRAHLSSP